DRLVARDPRLPAPGEVLGRARDRRPEAREALALERRLRNAALAQPERAIAREEALAEDHLQRREAARLLVVVLRVLLQDVLHVRGMRDEVRGPDEEPEPDDVAESRRGREE